MNAKIQQLIDGLIEGTENGTVSWYETVKPRAYQAPFMKGRVVIGDDVTGLVWMKVESDDGKVAETVTTATVSKAEEQDPTWNSVTLFRRNRLRVSRDRLETLYKLAAANVRRIDITIDSILMELEASNS